MHSLLVMRNTTLYSLFWALAPFLLICSRVTLAGDGQGGHCSEFLRYQNYSYYLQNGLDYSEIRPEFIETLETTPRFLLDRLPPSFEQIVSFDPVVYEAEEKVISKMLYRVQIDSRYAFQNVLALFKDMRSDSEYIFLGNGMYMAYLMAKTLFEETPMQKRIKFLAISRPLPMAIAKDPSAVAPYLEALKIGQNMGQTTVVIDSVSSYEPGSTTVVLVATAIRSFLKSHRRGAGRHEPSAIPIGITEGSEPYPGQSLDLQQYYSNLRKSGDEDIRSLGYPFLKASANWRSPPFSTTYGDQAKSILWNGKYSRLGEDGFPLGRDNFVFDYSQKDRSPESLAQIASRQAQKVMFYQRAIEVGKKHRRDLLPDIEAIVATHELVTDPVK